MVFIPLALLLLLPLLFLTAIGYIVAAYLMTKRFEAQHLETWKQMGEPNIIWNNSSKNNANLQRYLKNKEYLKIDDPKLTKWCRNTRLFYLVFSCSFILTIPLVVMLFWSAR